MNVSHPLHPSNAFQQEKHKSISVSEWLSQSVEEFHLSAPKSESDPVWVPQTPHALTFTDEALLGDGLLAYITALGLLEWLQLEGVCVDALQFIGLRGEEEEEAQSQVKTAVPEPRETTIERTTASFFFLSQPSIEFGYIRPRHMFFYEVFYPLPCVRTKLLTMNLFQTL